MNKIINDLSETQSIAKIIAKNITKATTILLIGEMGMGKTTFTQFLAKSFIKNSIKSPTYSIINSYKLDKDIDEFKCKNFHHIDFYRLKSEEELDDIGFEEIFDENSIIVIEWASMFQKYLDSIIPEYMDILKISIYMENQNRIINIEKE